ENYDWRCKTWLLPDKLPDGRVLGDLSIGDVQREQLGAVITKIKMAGRSPASIFAVVNPVNRYFAWLVETKVLPTSPATNLRYFVGRRYRNKGESQPQVFTASEGGTLLATAKEHFPGQYAMIATGLLAGLRFGECAALHKADVDLVRRRIHVQRTLSHKRTIAPPKDRASRHVEM